MFLSDLQQRHKKRTFPESTENGHNPNKRLVKGKGENIENRIQGKGDNIENRKKTNLNQEITAAIVNDYHMYNNKSEKPKHSSPSYTEESMKNGMSVWLNMQKSSTSLFDNYKGDDSYLYKRLIGSVLSPQHEIKQLQTNQMFPDIDDVMSKANVDGGYLDSTAVMDDDVTLNDVSYANITLD